jgi:hypothetical protein
MEIGSAESFISFVDEHEIAGNEKMSFVFGVYLDNDNHTNAWPIKPFHRQLHFMTTYKFKGWKRLVLSCV